MSTASEQQDQIPQRPPKIGELVQVRSRRWLVEDVILAGVGSRLRSISHVPTRSAPNVSSQLD